MQEDASRRLEDLEIKVAFVEHTLAELDGVMRTLADRLEDIARELVQIREELPEHADRTQEKPPHYGA